MSESIYEYNKSRETSENTGQNRYNLNKNTSDTAGFKHCLLVCLVFFITGKRDLGYRGQTASRLYRHYSRLYNTLTRRRLCWFIRWLCSPDRCIHIHAARFPLKRFGARTTKRVSNNRREQRWLNPRSPIVAACLLSPPPAPSFSSLCPTFFPRQGRGCPFRLLSSWGNANGSAGEGQDN